MKNTLIVAAVCGAMAMAACPLQAEAKTPLRMQKSDRAGIVKANNDFAVRTCRQLADESGNLNGWRLAIGLPDGPRRIQSL